MYRKTKNTKRNDKGQIVSFWTPDREKKAKRLYVKEGKSMRAVAAELKCSHATVQQYLERKGLVRSKKEITSRVLDNAARIKRLYIKEQMTCAEIAVLLSVSCTTIERHVSDSGYARSLSETFNLISIPSGKHNSAKMRSASIRDLMSVDLKGLTKDQYVTYARRLTEHVLKFKPDLFDKLVLRSKSFHVDHQVSLFNGFFRWSKRYGEYVPRKSPVPLTVICHPVNLRVMKNVDNGRKGSQNHFSIKKLEARIEKFTEENFDFFKMLKEST